MPSTSRLRRVDSRYDGFNVMRVTQRGIIRQSLVGGGKTVSIESAVRREVQVEHIRLTLGLKALGLVCQPVESTSLSKKFFWFQTAVNLGTPTSRVAGQTPSCGPPGEETGRSVGRSYRDRLVGRSHPC